jgi:hypothetical protein
MVDAATCNIDAFLWRDAYISSTQLSGPIWNKMSHCSLENYDIEAVVLSKTNSVLTGQ